MIWNFLILSEILNFTENLKIRSRFKNDYHRKQIAQKRQAPRHFLTETKKYNIQVQKWALFFPLIQKKGVIQI